MGGAPGKRRKRTRCNLMHIFLSSSYRGKKGERKKEKKRKRFFGRKGKGGGLFLETLVIPMDGKKKKREKRRGRRSLTKGRKKEGRWCSDGVFLWTTSRARAEGGGGGGRKKLTQKKKEGEKRVFVFFPFSIHFPFPASEAEGKRGKKKAGNLARHLVLFESCFEVSETIDTEEKKRERPPLTVPLPFSSVAAGEKKEKG